MLPFELTTAMQCSKEVHLSKYWPCPMLLISGSSGENRCFIASCAVGIYVFLNQNIYLFQLKVIFLNLFQQRPAETPRKRSSAYKNRWKPWPSKLLTMLCIPDSILSTLHPRRMVQRKGVPSHSTVDGDVRTFTKSHYVNSVITRRF